MWRNVLQRARPAGPTPVPDSATQHPPEPSPAPGSPTQRPQKAAPPPTSPRQRRLVLLATAFVTRGMEPEDAYKAALHYTQGSGRGRTWINALAEQDGAATDEAAARH